MSMINNSKLKEFADLLWAKIKTEARENIVNLSFDRLTNIITTTKKSGTNTQIDLNHLDTRWSNLEHTNEYSHLNLMEYDKKIQGRYFDETGQVGSNNEWSIYTMPVQPNEQYTILRKQVNDSRRFVFFNADGAVVSVVDAEYSNTNSWRRNYITVPDNATIAKMGFSFQHGLNTKEKLMVLRDRVTESIDFIPFTGGKSIQVGKEISLEFNNEGTNLGSDTIENAIKEIDGKVYTKIESDGRYYIFNNNAIEDANEFKQTCFARTSRNTTNLPQGVISNLGVIQYLRESNDIGIQIWYSTHSSPDHNFIWTRKLWSGNWEDWRRILDSSVLGNTANKIPVIGANGKLPTSIIPTASFEGVTQADFQNHVSENEQQHQTINSSISTNTQNINETKERVGNLESNAVKTNTQNTFTSKNVFTNRSPIVDKYFPIKSLSKDGLEQLHDGATYCCTPKEGLTGGQFISALLVPIHNSQPGDTIEATYFVVNADNSRVVVAAPNFSRHTVQDIEYKGHYCIVLDVNNRFSHAVAFGFGVRDTYSGGRRIGLLKQDLSHQSGNNFVWSDYNSPSVGSTLNVNGKFMIPYVITYKTNSEVVTRYDLVNNTVPTNNYRVGELKMLVYDAGESIEIGGHTWLRCDGQTVSSGDYSELYETVGCRFNTTGETTIRPANEDGTEVSIDFNLPTNQNVGYLYICAK